MADQSSGHGGPGYDGYVALGAVIRGETYHFEVVANESARGLMDLAIGRGLAIGNGILTVDDEEQAWERARPNQGDKGGFAARACLDMIGLRRRLAGQGANR
jgi:6,7-dimethyl-8-ribityllumazine synthase